MGGTRDRNVVKVQQLGLGKKDVDLKGSRMKVKAKEALLLVGFKKVIPLEKRGYVGEGLTRFGNSARK